MIIIIIQRLTHLKLCLSIYSNLKLQLGEHYIFFRRIVCNSCWIKNDNNKKNLLPKNLYANKNDEKKYFRRDWSWRVNPLTAGAAYIRVFISY